MNLSITRYLCTFSTNSCASRTLTANQIAFYKTHGYLHLPAFFAEEVQELRKEFESLLEKAPEEADVISNKDGDRKEHFVFQNDTLIRIQDPNSLSACFRQFAWTKIADIVESLLGQNLRAHHSKINIKKKSDPIAWHQDLQFWPFESDNPPLTVGIYLYDVTDEMGPMKVVPLSKCDQMFELVDEEKNWAGFVDKQDLNQWGSTFDKEAKVLTGKAGTVTIHNSRCVHGSDANTSGRYRTLLLNTFANANDRMVRAGTNELHLKHTGLPIIRGSGLDLFTAPEGKVNFAHAPNFKDGYKPTFFKKNPGEI